MLRSVEKSCLCFVLASLPHGQGSAESAANGPKQNPDRRGGDPAASAKVTNYALAILARDWKRGKLTFDIVVVGAGPAGLAAAIAASESGARVAILDDNPGPGGQIWRSQSNSWTTRMRASGAEFLPQTTVFEVRGSHRLGIWRNGEAQEITDRKSVG